MFVCECNSVSWWESLVFARMSEDWYILKIMKSTVQTQMRATEVWNPHTSSLGSVSSWKCEHTVDLDLLEPLNKRPQNRLSLNSSRRPRNKSKRVCIQSVPRRRPRLKPRAPPMIVYRLRSLHQSPAKTPRYKYS